MKLQNVNTLISYSPNWIIRDKNKINLNKKIINIDGFLKIADVSEVSEFYLKYNDQKAKNIQILIILVSTILILILIFEIVNRKE